MDDGEVGSAARIADRVELFAGRRLPARPVVIDDTTNFMAIDRDHVIAVGGTYFLVNGTERERRFGLVDEPKFWVKRATDLSTGKPCILKLVFDEEFRVTIGASEIHCRRNAEKEACVLELVRGDSRFMQGRSARDCRGNLVRIIDFIQGENLMLRLGRGTGPHEAYVADEMPAVLAKVADNFAGIARLHEAGLCHGDIRNDHLVIEDGTGAYRWIDFDLEEGSPEYDVWTLGNVLHFVAGRGFVTFRGVLERRADLAGRLTDDDASVFFPHRVMNLRKVFPHLPERLNEILLRFSVGVPKRYAAVAEVVADLVELAGSSGWPLPALA